MIYFAVIIVELTILFFLSKKIQQRIFTLFWGVTGKKNWSVYLMAVLFAPGTFFHEISHFLTALFLLVPVGDLKLLPEIREDEIKLGSVGVGKSDPFRRFLIGVAPFIFGVLAILLIIFLAQKNNLLGNAWAVILLGYLIFEIGNTMFASKKDLEGALGLLIFFVLVYILLLLLGININLSFFRDFLNLASVTGVLSTAALFLAFPLAVDVLIILIMRFV